jgi:hypothetical protein
MAAVNEVIADPNVLGLQLKADSDSWNSPARKLLVTYLASIESPAIRNLFPLDFKGSSEAMPLFDFRYFPAKVPGNPGFPPDCTNDHHAAIVMLQMAAFIAKNPGIHQIPLL